MNSIFSLQNSSIETYLRRSFQPSIEDPIYYNFSSYRFTVFVSNSAWSLQSAVFQIALCIESFIKLSFSLLLLRPLPLYFQTMRLLSVVVNVTLTTLSTTTIALSLLFPTIALNIHQQIIGFTQLTSSLLDIKKLELLNELCSSNSKKKFVFLDKKEALAFLHMTQTYPEVEDFFLLTRSVHNYWQNLNELLSLTESLDSVTYKEFKQSAIDHLKTIR